MNYYVNINIVQTSFMMHNLISVIIVNYKAADLLRDCILSISEQNVAIEVIVVDNNSGSYDRNIITSLKTNFLFLKYIFNTVNHGFSKANNQALEVCHGEYVLFLNPDTFLFPSCLERLISFLKITPEAGAVIPKLWMDKEKRFLMPPSYLPSFKEKFLTILSRKNKLFLTMCQGKWFRKSIAFWESSTSLTVDAISGAFFMTRRSLINTIGAFDERFPLYFEDSDLCHRIKENGLKLQYCPEAEAVHYYNQSAKSSAESIQKSNISERLYMEKHYNSSLIKVISRFDNAYKAVAVQSYKVWNFTKPIQSKVGNYLLFSPLATMIPCVAHKMTETHFRFNEDFVEKLAAGMYYAMMVTPYGIIKETFAMEKH